jgi:hypothetical protein
VSELYRPSDRRLSAKLVLTFANRGCHVVVIIIIIIIIMSLYINLANY